MLTFVLVLLMTIALSFLPERYLRPKTPQLKISHIILQALLVTQVFLGITLIVQRPIFAGLAVLIFLIILVGVSNAKFKALREPMVFSDFAMFAQAFKHPRLYFPFLGLAPVIIAPVLIIGLIIAVLSIEPALPFRWERIISSIGAILLAYYLSKKMALGLKLVDEPAEDNATHGLQNSLFAYTQQARTDTHRQRVIQALNDSPFATEPSCFKNTPPPLFYTF